MDDQPSQPAPPLPLWPWWVMTAAAVGCAAIASLTLSEPWERWQFRQPWGLVARCLAMIVYSIALIRGTRNFFRLRWRIDSRFPVASLATFLLFVLVLIGLWWAALRGVFLCFESRYPDPSPVMAWVIGCLAILEIAGRWQWLATSRFQYPLRELFLTVFLVAIAAGAYRYVVVHNERMQLRFADWKLLREMGDLTTAAKCFRADHGIAPPDGPNDFDSSVQKIFPAAHTWQADLAAAGLDPATMDAEESLVFWLGGMPAPDHPQRTIGFAAGSAGPFAPGPSRTRQHYHFESRRLTDIDGDGWPEYQAPPRHGSTNPMVFRLQGKEVVVAEYDARGPGRLPRRIYHMMDGNLEPVAP